MTTHITPSVREEGRILTGVVARDAGALWKPLWFLCRLRSFGVSRVMTIIAIDGCDDIPTTRPECHFTQTRPT